MIPLNAGTMSDEGIIYSFIQNPLQNTVQLKRVYQLTRIMFCKIVTSDYNISAHKLLSCHKNKLNIS